MWIRVRRRRRPINADGRALCARGAGGGKCVALRKVAFCPKNSSEKMETRIKHSEFLLTHRMVAHPQPKRLG